MSETLDAQRRVRFFAFAVVLLDATAYFFLVRSYWFAGHELATRNFDIVAGLVVSFFFA